LRWIRSKSKYKFDERRRQAVQRITRYAYDVSAKLSINISIANAVIPREYKPRKGESKSLKNESILIIDEDVLELRFTATQADDEADKADSADTNRFSGAQ